MNRIVWFFLWMVIVFSSCQERGFFNPFDPNTKVTLPKIRTNEITDIMGNSVKAGGNIIYDGGLPIITVGVVWHMNENPTLEHNLTKEAGKIGDFTSDVIGLTSNTTYYLKAYASNSMGVAYGEQISFKTNSRIPFNIGSGFNGVVWAMKFQSDGKVLVVGNFTSYNGIPVNRIIRLNVNGSIDNSFLIGSGFNQRVYSISLQSDGKIIVGGDFTSYNGIESNKIVRLKTDGSLDNSFSIGSGFNGSEPIRAITIQPDGRILVGGWFTSYKGNNSNRIIRLNVDGTVDSSFNIGSGFNDPVLGIVLQLDGKILVGGVFSYYNGTSKNKIVRLNSDGSIDNNFSIGNGFNSSAGSIVVQPDNKILIGGNFTFYDGKSSNRLIRLNNNGSIDISFINGTAFNDVVHSVVVQLDGKIIVGGGFTSFNDINQNRIIRLNENGTIDTTLNIGTGFNGSPWEIILQSDGKLLIGGYFSSYNETNRNRIIRLNTDGSIE